MAGKKLYWIEQQKENWGKSMEDRIQKALENHKKGYNCAQAVVCAYCDKFGMSEEIGFKMAEGFGAGMGAFQDTCGALSGAIMIAGLCQSSGCVEKGITKASTYKAVRAMKEQFCHMNQSTYCKDLRGENGEPKLRSCNGCIEDAARIVENYLKEHGL